MSRKEAPNGETYPVALTPKQVAEALGVKRVTVFRWIKSGELRALQWGTKLYRIERKDFEEFLARAAERAREGQPPLHEDDVHPEDEDE